MDNPREAVELSTERATALLDLCGRFDEAMIEDYNDDIPELSIPASKQQCMDALRALHAVYADQERYNQHLEVRKSVEKALDLYLVWADSVVPENEVELVRDIEEAAFRRAFRQPADAVIRWLEKDVRRQLAANEQASLHVMMEGQDKELQRWFRLEANPYSKHLDRMESSRQPVEMLIRGTAPIPLEIASLIMSHCSLEACVALRQVSAFWYSLYQQSSVIIEEKLQQRNPWIRPEAGMTWGDCGLVFVQRLAKWTVFEEPKFSNQEYSPLILTACLLEYNEKVPSDLELLETHTVDDDCCDHLCLENMVSLNPKTLEAHEDEHLEAEIVQSDGDKTVVRYAGFELTLPPYNGEVNVILRQHHIEVFIRTQVSGSGLFDMFLFPRYRPLHWKHAFKTSNVGGPPGHEIGHIYVDREHLFDLVSGELVNFYKFGEPVAFYNGLVWVRNRSRVFPILFDAGKTYSNGKSIVIGDGIPHLRQMKGDHTRFLTQRTGSGFCLVDLDTRMVTEIENPVYKKRTYERNDNIRELFYPGYVGHRFHVWCMDYETVMRYQER